MAKSNNVTPTEFQNYKARVFLAYRTLKALDGLLDLVHRTSYAEDVQRELCSVLVPAVQSAREKLEKLISE